MLDTIRKLIDDMSKEALNKSWMKLNTLKSRK